MMRAAERALLEVGNLKVLVRAAPLPGLVSSMDQDAGYISLSFGLYFVPGGE